MFKSALFAALFLIGCAEKTAPPAATGKSDHILMATLYHQAAAEYRALCYQAYNLAKLRFDEGVRRKTGKKPAVIVDVDETVLDNSYYEARQILDGTSYKFETWKEWTDLAKATPVPGAVEFLTYAASKGADIFYVTNRKVVEKKSTAENLKKMGFPNSDTSFVWPRTAESSKESRRQAIAATHDIVLLCGDNLNDFASVFENVGVERRFSVTDSLKNEFGKRFIVLPNPVYGDWDGAVLGNERGLSDSAKAVLRRKALKPY